MNGFVERYLDIIVEKSIQKVQMGNHTTVYFVIIY